MAASSPDTTVAIVVPARNAAATIGDLLDDLVAQGPEGARVVVVDDASHDGTGDEVARRAVDAPWLSVVRGAGAGPAAARNLGAAAVSTPWLAFIDADVRLDDGWLRSGLARARADDCDVIEGVVIPRGGAEHGLALHTARSDADGVFVTANLWVRRAVFEQVGGFDEGYRVPWREDTDLGWRLVEAGARVTQSRDVVVYHPHSRRRVRSLLREGARLDADTRLRRRFPDRFTRLLPRRGFRTTYAAAIAIAVAIAAPFLGLPLVADVGIALVAELLCLKAVSGAVASRSRPSWRELLSLAGLAPVLVLSRVAWVIRSNIAHRQNFW